MKNWILFTLFTFLIAGCNIEETEDSAGGDLFSGHKEVENEITLSGPDSGIYVETDELYFRVSHPYNLDVTGNPRIQLDVGGSTVYADYISGNGSKTLLFRYTVGAGDNDSDGIDFGSTTVDLNGGSINFTGTTGTLASALDFDALDLSGVIVDTDAPGTPTITGPLPTTYFLSDQLSVVATYGETVYVTGTPQLPLTVGGSTVYADYVSGSGSTSLLFKYTVTSSDYDMDGISIPSPITLNGGSIKDEAGNDASLIYGLTNHAFVYLDGDTPIVDTFHAPADGVYEPGEHLDFSLEFTEVVNVTGTPRVGVDIGGNIRYATYNSGSGTDTLLFRYTVVSGNTDDDGVDVENTIELNGGTIQDAGGRDAELSFDAPITPGATVSATLPTVTSITLPTVPTDGYFNSGEEIYITLNFNDIVNVTGYPQIGLELDSSGSTIYVDYNSGSGTTSLVFRYVVVDEVDEDHDGFGLTSPINLNGGSILNASLTAADLDYSTVVAATDFSSMLVDATTPVVTGITPPSDDTYAGGEDVDFVVTFSEIVNVTGSPQIELDVGGSTEYATYSGGTGTNALTFTYTVATGDEDTDGISISSTSIQQSGGLIEDRGGNEFVYNNGIFGFIPTMPSVYIDGVRPRVTSVTIPAGTYTDGQTVTATVTFDEAVVIVGSPTLTGTFDTSAGGTSFSYQTGDGTTTLTFDYTVQTGDEDLTGIALVNSFSGGSTSITDVWGNNMMTSLYSNNSFPSVELDALAATVTITSPTNGDYVNSNDYTNYAITGTCDDAEVTTSYDIQLDGTSVGTASCDGANLTGSFNSSAIADGTRTLTVYTDDGNGNTSTSTGVSIEKDIIAPTLSSVSAPSNGNYTYGGGTMDFTATFDESVDVTGTRIPIILDSGTVYANYASGTGGTVITYTYSIGDSDYDPNGISMSDDSLEAGTIQDAAGNDATITFSAPGTGSITVNDGTPAFDWQGENGTGDHDYGNPNTDVILPYTALNSDFTFTVQNTGDAPSSTGINISVTGDAEFSKQTDNCSGFVLPINGTCTVTIRYTDPDGFSNGVSATATVDDSGSTADLILNGD